MSAEGTQRYLATKVLMMPRDTNPQGTIFGGVLLSYIDQAGAAGARFEMTQAGWPESSIVTVAVNGVEFLKPVFVGDLVSFWTQLERVGRTSITIRVTVETDRRGEAVRLTEAQVKYVAIEAEGDQRVPIPIRG